MSYPAEYNFNVYQGDTVTFTLTYKEGTLNAEVGVDLTDATMLCMIAPAKGGAIVTTMTATAAADQVATPGKMSVVLSGANSALLRGPSYVYDLQVTWADLTVQTLISGVLTVTSEVSTP
jgi:hypothetical protein